MLGQTNAKIVSGGNVEVLETKDLFIKNNGSTVIDAAPDSLKIDDNNAIDFTYQSSYAPSSTYNTVVIYSAMFSPRTTKSSISLNFGQGGSGRSYTMGKICSISPNKDRAVLSGLGSNTNVYVIPLTKNNNDYSLGTPISYDIGTASSNCPIWVDNDTFIKILGTSINVFTITNNEITLSKTIQTDFASDIVNIRFYNGKIICANASVVEVIDLSTEEVLYSLSTTLSSAFIYLFKNFAVIGKTSNPYFFILDLDTLQEKTMTATTTTEATGGAPISYFNDDYIEYDENSIAIARAPYGGKYAVCLLNFSQNTVTQISVLDVSFTSNGTYIRTASFLGTDNAIYLLERYTSIISGTGYFWYLNKNVDSKIAYKGYDYSVTCHSVSE